MKEIIVESMREAVAEYAQLLRTLAGNNAKSLSLFGAIAAGSFDATRETARSVLVLDHPDLAMLRRLAEHGPRLGKMRIAAPLIMTPQYIKSSLDTFPLEFLEIHQAHITIFGDDPFAGLDFVAAHVRLQCERELKTMKLGMHQGLLAAAGSEKFIAALESDVSEALMRTLRGLLWLKGHKKAKPYGEVLQEMEKINGRALTGVRDVLEPGGPQGWREFDALYKDIEALGQMVNDW